MPQRESKKSGVKIEISLEDIIRTSKMKLEDAAEELNVSRSTLKRVCRDYGFARWPPRNYPLVDGERIPPLNNDLPSNKDPISILNTKPKENTAMQDANVVTIKAKYGNDITIRFRLSLSSTLVDLKQKVAKRLKLEVETYDIKYRDPEDGDLILIACDEDLHDYIHTSKSLDSTSIKVEIFTQQGQMHECTGAHYQQPYEAKQDCKRGAESGKETMEESGCPLVETLGEKERAQKRVKKSKDVSTKQVWTLGKFGTENAVENRKNSSAINPEVPFLHKFPIAIQPYIQEIRNVPSDGNCGFWAIGGLLNLGEIAAVQVRKDLINELYSDLDYYSQMWDEDRIQGLTEILSCLEPYPRKAHWMDMPDMGPLIASTYGVTLFHLSENQCITFLPHRSGSTTKIRKEIALGFVNNNHFVQVFLLPGHPVPPITPYWHKWRCDAAKDWENIYTKRIQRWKEVVSPEVITTDVIEL